MAKKTEAEPIRLQGRPNRLVGLIPLPSDAVDAFLNEPLEITLAGDGPARGGLRRRVRRGDASAAVLKLRLPRTTAPGRYQGAAEIGGRLVPLVADVAPFHRLRVTPASVSLTVVPGKPVPLEVVLANLGNVTEDIATRHTFCVFDAKGIDRSLFVALAEDPPQGKPRIDRFMDELADHHGGLVRLDVVAGDGTLKPGEQRAVRFELRFSERMRPGRTYAGAWTVENMRFGVRAEATAAEPRARKEPR